MSTDAPIIEQAARERLAKELVSAGYKQISSKYRIVARLPEGKSGYEALRDADPDFAGRLLANFQRDCEDQFLRVCANNSHRMTLDELTFAAFRAAGGRTPR